MARKKDEQPEKPAPKQEQKAKTVQKKSVAGGATDRYLQPNDQHYIGFKQQLAALGLMMRDVPGDGNCLFRALNDQLEGHSRNHHRMREDTVRFMIEHRKDFEPFVEDDVPFIEHVNRLRQLGTYGGQDALVAFARMHKATVIIHQLNAPLWQIEGGPSGCPQLHLSYHNSEHYSSVRRVGDTSESPANIRINVSTTGDAAQASSSSAKNRRDRYDRRTAGAADRRIYNELVERIAGRTGCKDLALISETIDDFSGDEEAAADYLMSFVLATDPLDGNSSGGQNGEEKGTNGRAESCGGASRKNESGTIGRANRPKTSEKRLTNKERKELNRREKMQRVQNGRQQESPSDQEKASDSEAIVIEAAVGCLRI